MRIQRKNSTWSFFCVIVLLLSFLSGCGQRWEVIIVTPEGGTLVVDRVVLEELHPYGDEKKGVPLERILWIAGYYVIDNLILVDSEGSVHEFIWADTAENAWWRDNGKIFIAGETMTISRIEVIPPAMLDQVQTHITEIAPAAATALGLPKPDMAGGTALGVSPTDHVMLLFLDGFGYVRYMEALEEDLIPNIAGLPAPLVGLTEYPPCTRVGTAALLTGASSRTNGVDMRSVRSTEIETLFDVASAAELSVVSVEGDALAFNLRGTEIQLSGDRDGNGGTDDNVLANALSMLEEGMPDLFYVHFHGIDDAGHTYGPGTPEEEAVIAVVDTAVGQLLNKVPADTLVIIFADHGMHMVDEEGRLGNHGNLITRDMFIPIFVLQK